MFRIIETTTDQLMIAENIKKKCACNNNFGQKDVDHNAMVFFL